MQREKSNCSNDKPEAARACKTIPQNHFKSDREAAVQGEGKARSRPLAGCQNSLQEARVSPGAWWLEGWSRLPGIGDKALSSCCYLSLLTFLMCILHLPPMAPIYGGVTFRGPEKYDRWKFFYNERSDLGLPPDNVGVVPILDL